MTVPAPGLVEFTRPQDLAEGAPLVVLGPALGTSVTHLYAAVAPLLAERFHVIGWDLPGHGVSDPAQEFTLGELARAVADAVTEHAGARSWHMAGTSIGGAAVQQLLAQDPERVASAALIATSNYFPDPRMWRERAELVASAGTPTQVIECAKAWFAPDFLAEHSERGTPLLHDLRGRTGSVTPRPAVRWVVSTCGSARAQRPSPPQSWPVRRTPWWGPTSPRVSRTRCTRTVRSSTTPPTSYLWPHPSSWPTRSRSSWRPRADAVHARSIDPRHPRGAASARDTDSRDAA